TVGLGRLLLRNRVMDRTAMTQIISSLVTNSGKVYTAHILDQPKALGFQQATNQAISLGIDDLLVTPSREWLVRDAEIRGFFEEDHYRYGNVHAVERSRRSIEAWYATSEYVKTEMNLHFRTIDPLNPVHVTSPSGARGNISQVHQLLGMRGLMLDPEGQIIDLPIRSNFREGLSLTEYIISRHGARKGIVDIAIRTADAGYPTRRPVEVVQRVVARKTDCGTLRCLTVSPTRGKQNRQTIAQSRLIGRVLAGNLYVDARCTATRDQDAGAEPADRPVAFQIRSINIRSPLACNSMLWIRRLRHGRSLSHKVIVGVGEAVGILAGQSIGEPGTQSTLRTFHTGGIFTGYIAQHIRAPFTGTIRYNAALAHLTRTRHGQPAWICCDDLPVDISNDYEARHIIIPAQSLILAKDSQHVEPKQVIAEVHIAAPVPGEIVHRRINSSMHGELHVGTRVRQSFEHLYSNIQMLPETSYVRVLSGAPSSSARPIFHGARDRIDTLELSAGEGSSLTDELDPAGSPNPVDDCSASGLILVNRSRICRVQAGVGKNFIYISPPHGYDRFLPRRALLLRGGAQCCTGDKDKNLVVRHDKVSSHIAGDVATPKGSGYTAEEQEKVTHGAAVVKVDPSGQGSREVAGSVKIHETIVGEGHFSRISEDLSVARDPLLNASLVANVGASTRLVTFISIYSYGCRPSGFVAGAQGLLEKELMIDDILRGTVTRTKGYKHKLCGGKHTLAPPLKILPGEFEPAAVWDYYYPPCADPRTAGRLLASLSRLAIECNATRLSSIPIPAASPGRALEEEFVGDLEVRNPFFRVSTNSCIAQYYPNYRYSLRENQNSRERGCEMTVASFRYIYDAEVCHTGRSSNQRFRNGGIIRVAPDRYRERTSFLVSSPSYTCNIQIFAAPKMSAGGGEEQPGGDNAALRVPATPPSSRVAAPNNRRKNGAQLCSILEGPPASHHGSGRHNLSETLGFLGDPRGSTARSACIPRWNRKIRKDLLDEDSLDDFNTSRVPLLRYLRDENRTILGDLSIRVRGRRRTPTKLNPLKQRARRSQISLRATTNMRSFFRLGLLICDEGVLLAREPGPHYQSFQVEALDTESAVIRSAEPYSADRGATVCSGPGSFVGKGDTLMTPINERSRFEDTIFQGLPKIEQFLESRPDTSVLTDSKDSFGDWNSFMAWVLGCLTGSFLSAKISLERSQATSVDRTGNGYRSQGVQVADKHAETIVRQIASKSSNMEDGMANASPPGEPAEPPRARRMNCASEAKSTYRPVLPGVTRASLSTRSFLSEASPRDTVRVLARAAIRGQMDWLKGPKENALAGGTVPAGTGAYAGALQQQVVISSDEPETLYVSETDKLFHTMREHPLLLRNVGAAKYCLPGNVI
uniref:DNA-directed RNA polymerase n=1 Tax=Megaloselaginella exaltata TaxID=3140882 RepID=A0A7U3UJW7_9TRAC|nr:RNA polymerase beta'' subunit [Selaginella exaltata]